LSNGRFAATDKSFIRVSLFPRAVAGETDDERAGVRD